MADISRNLQFTENVVRLAVETGTRTGQHIMNILPLGASLAVTGTPFDPYEKDMFASEVFSWVQDHLIFKGESVIGVIDGNEILWVEEDE